MASSETTASAMEVEKVADPAAAPGLRFVALKPYDMSDGKVQFRKVGGTAPPLRAAQAVLDGYLHTYLRADEDRYKDEPQGSIIVSVSYLPFHQSDSVL